MAVYIESPEKLIFVHVPKNGGTSIAHWLVENFHGVKSKRVHWPLHKLKKEFPDHKSSFGIVRNPWDRMVSYYFFIKKAHEGRIKNIEAGKVNKPHKANWNKDFLNKKLIDLNKGFEYFINNPELWTNLAAVQKQKLLIEDADYILTFENLEKDFLQIQNLLSCHTPLPKYNTTVHSFYKDYYTSQELVDRVGEYFKEDIEAFNYDF